MPRFSRNSIFWFVTCSLNLSLAVASAQNVAPLQLQIVDVNNIGIDGVDFKISSMVFADDTGLSLAINDLKTVDGGPLKVDSDGKVTIAIPDVQLGELIRFRLNAEHPSFAEFNDWVSVEFKQLNKVTLSRGVRIAVTAVAEDTGAKLTDNVYVIAEQKIWTKWSTGNQTAKASWYPDRFEPSTNAFDWSSWLTEKQFASAIRSTFQLRR